MSDNLPAKQVTGGTVVLNVKSGHATDIYNKIGMSSTQLQLKIMMCKRKVLSNPKDEELYNEIVKLKNEITKYRTSIEAFTKEQNSEDKKKIEDRNAAEKEITSNIQEAINHLNKQIEVKKAADLEEENKKKQEHLNLVAKYRAEFEKIDRFFSDTYYQTATEDVLKQDLAQATLDWEKLKKATTSGTLNVAAHTTTFKAPEPAAEAIPQPTQNIPPVPKHDAHFNVRVPDNPFFGHHVAFVKSIQRTPEEQEIHTAFMERLWKTVSNNMPETPLAKQFLEDFMFLLNNYK